MLRDIAHSPREGLDQAWEDIRRHSERPAPALDALPSPQWEQRLHELLGARWPCPELTAFEPVWEAIQAALRRGGLETGRGAYGGWDDGDPGLARSVWCITSHLRPLEVVETGVARGITSRTVLERLQQNGGGRLWSIDLPARNHPSWAGEIGYAVPPGLRSSWTLIEGSSRRKLPALLKRLGTIDLFVHDSLHSERNMRFELSRAWRAVRPGGAAVIDDVHMNSGFHRWLADAPDAEAVICLPDDGQALFAAVVRRPR
jgi:hypothetical protein